MSHIKDISIPKNQKQLIENVDSLDIIVFIKNLNFCHLNVIIIWLSSLDFSGHFIVPDYHISYRCLISYGTKLAYIVL